jgi:sodium pump decarboxylase gamma subunit
MNPETLALGVQTTVVGLGIVFAVLVILMFFTGWLAQIIDSASGPKPPAGGGGGGRPAAPAPQAAPVPAAPESGALSAQTVAAIVAAVSAFTGKSMEELRFAAIRRTGGMHTGWSQSAVTELINTRQQYL